MKRYETILCGAILLVIVVLYTSMAPTRLSSANFGTDGGDFLAAVLTKGIPHPSGYPLYMLLSIPFQLLKVSTPVWRQTLLSIISAALTTVILYCIVRISAQNQFNKKSVFISSLVSSFILAISPIFWSQSVIIEVYSLNALFISLSILWLFIVFQKPNKNNIIKTVLVVCLPLLCGLGLGNHVSILLIYPLILFGIWRLHKSNLPKWKLVICTIGWFSGLLTYLILPVRAQLHPAVNWGNPETMKGFLWLLSGGDYQNLLFGIKLIEYPGRILSWINLLLQQFGVFGLIAGLFGIYNPKRNKLAKWSTVYIFSIYSLFAIGYKTNDSFVYLIPAIIIFSLWCGWGINDLFQQNWKKINLGWLMVSVILIYSIFIIPSRYQSIAPRNADLANYAETTLSSASENAYLFPENDGQTFSLWYYQYGLGIRPDVRIVSKGLLQFDWYRENLLRLYPKINLQNLE